MLADLRYRLRAILRPGRMEADLAEEIRLHVEREIEADVQRGLSVEEARRRASLALGGPEQVKEACRDARGVAAFDSLLQDVRYGARTLWKSRGYTAAALLTLALGTGINAGIFSVANGLLLRPLPVRDPERLVTIREEGPADMLDPWVWEQIRDRPRLFERACGWMPTRFNVADRGEADYVQGLYATGAFFETLGVPAAVGRTFSPADDRRGGGPGGAVAVISHAFWQRRFGGAADAIGRSLTLDRVSYTIVGVTPQAFLGPMVGRSFDVAVPAGVTGRAVYLYLQARLRGDQTVESAMAGLRASQAAIREGALPSAIAAGWPAERYLQQPLTVSRAVGTDWARTQFQRPLLAMLALAGLVVLIGCANVANLVLVRAVARRHELGMRRALGASRGRIARQVLVECALLAAGGALLGLAGSGSLSRLLVAQVSTDMAPVALDLSFDWRVLGCTVIAMLGTTLLIGLLPALRAASVDPSDAIGRGGTARAGARHSGVHHALVVVQVTVSVVLVVAAGLFVRTFAALATLDLGFDRDRVVIVGLNAQDARVPPAARPFLYERVRQAVAGVPGVADAVTLLRPPIVSAPWVNDIHVAGLPAGTGGQRRASYLNAVGSGYFSMFGTPILDGRGFDAGDRPDAPLVAVVNEEFARRFLAGRRPVGESLSVGARPPVSAPFRIVGLVKDSPAAADNGLRERIPPVVYLCVAQMRPGIANFTPQSNFRIGVRLTRDPTATMTRSIAAAIGRVEPDLRVTVTTMGRTVDATLAPERLAAILSGLFGTLALVLAAIGIFGVTAYGVGRRRGEIGLRIALGATAASVVRLVLRRVVVLLGVGIAVGGAVSYWASRLTASLLFGLQPQDPLTLAGAALVLAAVGLLAGFLPARRASRLDPAAVLRSE